MLIKMAFRNIFRNRRRSILTGLMMIGGFVFISASLSLVGGTYGSIISLFTGQFTGHVQIANKEYIDNPSLHKTVKNYRKILEESDNDSDVRATAPRIYSEALVYLKKKTFGAQIVGIDPALEDKATSYGKRILKGESFSKDSEYEAIVGKSVAKILEAKPGDEIVLISQGADGSIANDIFKVKGIIGTDQEGRDDYRIYLPLKTASEFFVLYNRVHEISVHLKNFKKAKAFSRKLKFEDKNLVSRPWQEVEADFYRTMQADKNGNNVSMFILMLMVGVGTLNTVLMSTLERTREFGVLKALGTLPKHLFSLIILEGISLSIICTAIGIVIATGVNYYLTYYGIQFREPISFAGTVLFEMRGALTFDSFFYPGLIITVTTMFASVYPGLKSSKISVAEALREF